MIIQILHTLAKYCATIKNDNFEDYATTWGNAWISQLWLQNNLEISVTEKKEILSLAKT